MSDLVPETDDDLTTDAATSPDLDDFRPANDFMRLGVVLANGALAATRSTDVPPRFRLAYRLGVAALTGVTTYAQEMPSYTGRRRQVGARTMAGISLAAAAATFAGADLVDKLNDATDAWLERRGVRNPQAFLGLATVALTGAVTVAQDYLPDEDEEFGEGKAYPLPDRIRAALTVVLSGLEDRDPASAAALHQQLDSATIWLPEGSDVENGDLWYFALEVPAEGMLRAVPHQQTLPAHGRFSHGDRELDITIHVMDGQLAAVSLDDPALSDVEDWEEADEEGDDDAPITLAEWPEPGDIRVVFDDNDPA